MPEHPDLEEEQEFLDRAYDGLDAMRDEARRMLECVLDLGRGGTFQSRTERDIVVRTSLARLAQLDIGDQALCFGRIDRLPEPGDGPRQRSRRGVPHRPAGRLGSRPRAARRRLAGAGGRALLPGHRPRSPGPGAPPAPRGAGPHRGRPRGRVLRRPRRPRCRRDSGGTAVTDGERRRGERLLSDGLALGGPGALLAALGQVRTGHMGDIVGTIQREQDEIIRSPLAGVLVVQGGPGTGKTAVALHRAAYLLYTHRFPLERQGVLVVGPNPLFLRYIEQVLPSLGETGVTLSTVAGLVPEIRVRGVDEPAVAQLKGDVRMVQVLARAVRTRQRPLRATSRSPSAPACCGCAADDRGDRRPAKRRPGTHNARRRFVEAQVVRALADEYRRPARARRRRGRRTRRRAPRSRTTWRSVSAASPRWPRRWTGCGRASRLTSSSTTSSGRARCSRRRQGHPRPRPRCSGCTDPAACRSTTCPGPSATPRSIDEARALLGPRRGRARPRVRAQRNEEGAAPRSGSGPRAGRFARARRRRR